MQKMAVSNTTCDIRQLVFDLKQHGCSLWLRLQFACFLEILLQRINHFT